jgi:protein-tyrosine-phosphatase
VVQPSFRQTPWAAEADTAADTNRAAARVAFISESGLCRSVLAAAAFKAALHSRSPELAAKVVCECRATKDYCLGQGPDPLTVLVAAERGWELPEAYKVQQFYESRDIVEFDVCLVMDKFTAADVLREVGPPCMQVLLSCQAYSSCMPACFAIARLLFTGTCSHASRVCHATTHTALLACALLAASHHMRCVFTRRAGLCV